MYIFYSSYSSNITEVCNLKRVRVCVFLTSHSQTRFWNLLVEISCVRKSTQFCDTNIFNLFPKMVIFLSICTQIKFKFLNNV